MDTQAREWLNVEQVAAYLKCRPKTIYNYVSKGIIPHNKKAGLLRFRKDRIDAWMDTGQIETRDEYFERVTERGA